MRSILPDLASSAFWQKLGIAIGGVILGSLLGDLLRSDVRIFSALAALTVVTFMMHLLAIEDHTGRAAMVTGLCEQLSSDWASIKDKFGLEVQVQLVRELNRAESVEGDIVSNAMRSAKSEILVADIGSTHVGPDIGIRDVLRESHLKRLIHRASDQEHPVEYRRLYQIKDPSAIGLFRHDPVLRDHCRDMCNLHEELPDQICFSVSPPVFPYSWIIVDQEILVLELYRYPDADTEPRYDGAVVVRDPSGELIGPFLRMWRELERDATKVRLNQLDS